MKVFIVVFLDNLICKLRLYNITCTCIGYNVYAVGNNSFVLKFPFVIINYVKLIRVPLVLAVSHTLPRKVSASSSYAMRYDTWQSISSVFRWWGLGGGFLYSLQTPLNGIF